MEIPHKTRFPFKCEFPESYSKHKHNKHIVYCRDKFKELNRTTPGMSTECQVQGCESFCCIYICKLLSQPFTCHSCACDILLGGCFVHDSLICKGPELPFSDDEEIDLFDAVNRRVLSRDKELSCYCENCFVKIFDVDMVEKTCLGVNYLTVIKKTARIKPANKS